jgi:hypothetical protein
MAYSDSMHFSDKLSYKILFILSYGLEDTNLSRFKYLQEFLGEKNREAETEPDLVGVGNKRAARGARQQRTNLGQGPSSARSEQQKQTKKVNLINRSGDLNPGPERRIQRNRPDGLWIGYDISRRSELQSSQKWIQPDELKTDSGGRCIRKQRRGGGRPAKGLGAGADPPTSGEV